MKEKKVQIKRLFDMERSPRETGEPESTQEEIAYAAQQIKPGKFTEFDNSPARPLNQRFQKETSTELQRLCRDVLEKLSPEFHGAAIDACFYPYIGLTHTIRRRKSGWIVRVSDHCRQAAHPALEAIVTILACKALRRRVPKPALRIYDEWRNEPVVSDAVKARRTAKGRKCFSTHDGRWHPLPEICSGVNSRFFNNQVEIRKIGWGIRVSWGRLGHYDPTHNTITLSPVLDSPNVPRFVLDFIVYHEMLHAVFEGAENYGFRRHHPPAFNRAERAHPDYEAVKKFIKKFCSKRRRIPD